MSVPASLPGLIRFQVLVVMSDSSPSVPGSSRVRSSSTVIQDEEVSLFINSDSYVGREVARRIVARSSGFAGGEADDDCFGV